MAERSERKGPALPKVEIDRLKEGSKEFVLEAALAMQLGKLAPVGYALVADFFTNDKFKTTPVHNVWLTVEAELAGKTEDLERDFPEAPLYTRYILDYMQSNNLLNVEEIRKKVLETNYKFSDLQSTS